MTLEVFMTLPVMVPVEVIMAVEAVSIQAPMYFFVVLS